MLRSLMLESCWNLGKSELSLGPSNRQLIVISETPETTLKKTG